MLNIDWISITLKNDHHANVVDSDGCKGEISWSKAFEIMNACKRNGMIETVENISWNGRVYLFQKP